jgi:hypothetical protein
MQMLYLKTEHDFFLLCYFTFFIRNHIICKHNGSVMVAVQGLDYHDPPLLIHSVISFDARHADPLVPDGGDV